MSSPSFFVLQSSFEKLVCSLSNVEIADNCLESAIQTIRNTGSLNCAPNCSHTHTHTHIAPPYSLPCSPSSGSHYSHISASFAYILHTCPICGVGRVFVCMRCVCVCMSVWVCHVCLCVCVCVPNGCF